MTKIFKTSALVSVFLFVLALSPHVVSAMHHYSSYNTASTNYFSGTFSTPLTNNGASGWGPYPYGDSRYTSNSDALTDRVYLGVPQYLQGGYYGPTKASYLQDNWFCSMTYVSGNPYSWTPYGCPDHLPMDWYHWWTGPLGLQETKWTITGTSCFGAMAYVSTDPDGAKIYYCTNQVLYLLRDPVSIIFSGTSDASDGQCAYNSYGDSYSTCVQAAGPGVAVLSPTAGSEVDCALNPNDPVCTAPPAPDFTATISPSNASVVKGATATYNVTLTSQNGMTGELDLGAYGGVGCPGGSFSDCSVTPSSVIMTDGGTATATYSVVTHPSSVAGNGYPVGVTVFWPGHNPKDALATLDITNPPSKTADIKVSDSAHSVVNSDGPIVTDYGNQVSLSWSSSNVSSCSVTSSSNGDTWNTTTSSGVNTSNLTANSNTYTISCDGGAATDSVTVNIPPPPTNLDYTCNGGNTVAHITWTAPGSYNTFALRANNGFNNTTWPSAWSSDTAVGTSYDYTVTPNSQYTFYIATRDTTPPVGNAMSTIVSKNVQCPIGGLPATADIKANGSDAPAAIPYNTAATLSWTYTNATSCVITSPGSPSIYPNGNGSISTGPLTATTVYSISCQPSGPSSSDSVTVPIINPTFNLNVTLSGQGRVTSSPSGIDCGNTCGATYDLNTSVDLTASPSVGRIFTGWSGDCSGNNPVCTVTITGNKNVRANFAVDPKFKEF